MWILDCYSERSKVVLWIKKGKVRRYEFKISPYFLLHLPDPTLHVDMIEALETRYRLEECEFRTIYGSLPGYRVQAGRRVAERIERQAKDAKLFNVDVRLEQRFMVERGIFPCAHVLDDDEKRFDAEFELPLSVLRVDVKGDIFGPELYEIRVNGDRLAGSEREMLTDLFSAIEAEDPDVILFRDADFWVPHVVELSGNYGLENTISRTGRFRKLPQKSYWSYGRARYRRAALIPEGRILIDTESFNFRESGLNGILLASRLAVISPNLAARFSPGTLISTYEVFEALKRGIAVPFRKSDAEERKTLEELKAADRGGMIFQPSPGVYEDVWQLDFTSMYPSIIVKYNLSPETISGRNGRGFLAEVLEPLLKLRLETKKLKKGNPEYTDLDSILKWMLVTCFGYTGYRNAKFGRIEVHEEINRIGRETLLQTKEIAEEMGFEVLHGIVDCLWLRGEKIEELKQRVEDETGLLTDIEHYSWIVFLPMKDGFGAYNRYYGRLESGKMKLRGVAARRRDTPEYVRKLQLDAFEVLSRAENIEDISRLASKLVKIYKRYVHELRYADPKDLVIRKVVSRTNYSKNCVEAAAVRTYRKAGIDIKPGMTIEYVVVDARKHVVDVRDFESFDYRYYLKLLERAWTEIEFLYTVIRT